MVDTQQNHGLVGNCDRYWDHTIGVLNMNGGWDKGWDHFVPAIFKNDGAYFSNGYRCKNDGTILKTQPPISTVPRKPSDSSWIAGTQETFEWSLLN